MQSPQEYLHGYLRLARSRAGGAAAAVRRLARARLGPLRDREPERTPALERACYRLFLSQERVDASRTAVIAILSHRLERSESLVGNVGDEFRGVLDRLIAATEDRDQAITELAREVRHRYYDEPVIEAAREHTYAAMEEHLRALGADPGRSDREERVRALVACPQPLAAWLTGRIGGAAPGFRRVLIETMTRRYYRVRELGASTRPRSTGTPS